MKSVGSRHLSAKCFSEKNQTKNVPLCKKPSLWFEEGKKSKWLYENITIIVVLTTSSIIVLFSILFFVRESFVSSPKPSN